MYPRKIPALAAAALTLWLSGDASATLLDVELENGSGPHVFGQVDTLTDTFTVTGWTENTGGPTWWTPSDLPRSYLAQTLSGAFDVPDDWDGTIGSDWGFINPQTLGNSNWLNGTFSPTSLIRGGWGGWVDGSGVIDVSFAENIFGSVPFTSNSVAQVGFTTVIVTAVPEPRALVMCALALAALRLRALRVRSSAALKRRHALG